MQKWEYLHIKLERKPWNEEDSSFIQREHGVDLDELGFEFYMKDLGIEGWELVSAFPVEYYGLYRIPSGEQVGENRDWRGVTTQIRYVFKRPATEQGDEESE